MSKTKKNFMERGRSPPSSVVHKSCQTKTISNGIIKYPTFSCLTKDNFEHSVDFNTAAKWPCRNSWYSDIRTMHVRNKRILDLPFSRPKCCTEIYNILVDRGKAKQLEKYGLTRPVRERDSLEMEEIERCIPLEDVEKPNIKAFPECYTLVECSSEDEGEEENDDEECDESGDEKSKDKKDSRRREEHLNICICRGKANKGKDIIKHWKELLHVKDRQLCEGVLDEEIKKHKLGNANMKLNLKRII